MRKGIESRTPTIEKKEIKLTPEEELIKRGIELKEIEEITDKLKPTPERRGLVFKKVNREKKDWEDDRLNFLKKTTHEEMGHWPEIEGIKSSLRAELSPNEQKLLVERELNEEAMKNFEAKLSTEKFKTYTIEYGKAEKDFDEKLEKARKEGKEKREI